LNAKTKFLIALLISFAGSSCKKDNAIPTVGVDSVFAFDEIKKASWFIGTWQSTTKRGTLTETWGKLNDSVLIGKTYFIAGKDTLFSESNQVLERNKKLYYVPTLSDQNEGKAISFVLTNTVKNELVFENPMHDFPQKISYNRVGSDSLIAKISGIKNGKEAIKTFQMKKIKNLLK